MDQSFSVAAVHGVAKQSHFTALSWQGLVLGRVFSWYRREVEDANWGQQAKTVPHPVIISVAQM